MKTFDNTFDTIYRKLQYFDISKVLIMHLIRYIGKIQYFDISKIPITHWMRHIGNFNISIDQKIRYVTQQ